MSAAFGRKMIVEVSTAPASSALALAPGLTLDAFTCTANIRKDLSENPNECELEVVNLGPDARSKIQASVESEKGALVRVAAGYGDDPANMFLGYCNLYEYYKLDATTSAIRLSIYDGAETEKEHPSREREKVPEKVSIALSKMMPVAVALKQVCAACKVELATLTAGLPLQMRNGSPTLPSSVHLQGPRMRMLAKFCNALKMTWSVQDNVLEGSLIGVPFDPKGPLLRSNGGTLRNAQLVAKGEVQLTCLADARLRPGTAVLIDGATVQGAFTLDSVEHSVSTAVDGPWQTSATGFPVG